MYQQLISLRQTFKRISHRRKISQQPIKLKDALQKKNTFTHVNTSYIETSEGDSCNLNLEKVNVLYILNRLFDHDIISDGFISSLQIYIMT